MEKCAFSTNLQQVVRYVDSLEALFSKLSFLWPLQLLTVFSFLSYCSLPRSSFCCVFVCFVALTYMLFLIFVYVNSYITLSTGIFKLHRERKQNNSALIRETIHIFIYSIKIFLGRLIVYRHCAQWWEENSEKCRYIFWPQRYCSLVALRFKLLRIYIFTLFIDYVVPESTTYKAYKIPIFLCILFLRAII